jgi:hypothetical protein
MPEGSDRLHDARLLGADVRRVGAAFLLAELHNGLALLDTIEVSRDRDADERRRALALEAYGVVAERLARTGDQATVLTDAERDEITPLLEDLRARLERDEMRGGR